MVAIALTVIVTMAMAMVAAVVVTMITARTRAVVRLIRSATLAMIMKAIRTRAGNTTVVPSLRTRCAATVVVAAPALPRSARLRRRCAVHRALGNRVTPGRTHAPILSLLTDAIARAASARVFRIPATAHHVTIGTTQATRAMKFYPGVVVAAVMEAAAVAGVTVATAFAIHPNPTPRQYHRLQRRRAAHRALVTRATSGRTSIRVLSLKMTLAVTAVAASAQMSVGKPAQGNRATIGQTPVPSSRMIMIVTVLAVIVRARRHQYRRPRAQCQYAKLRVLVKHATSGTI